MAVDSTGNLYIADSANNVIREVSAGTGTITTVAGNGFGGGPFHSCGLSGDGGPATEAELCWPQSVAVDAKGNLYITDSGNGLIREVNAKTHVITTVAGDPQSGFSGFLANANPATIVHLTDPLGMTVDGDGNFYFVEPLFCVVWEVKAANGYIYAVAGDYTCAQGEDGVKATSTSLGSVSGVAVDSAGDLYVAENGAQLVRRVDGKTGLLTTAAGALINPISDIAGMPGYTGDGGLATLAELDGPYGVATDGNLYITDSENNAVRKVTATTAVMTAAPVATPAAPAPGLGFGATQEVTLSDGTAGATIYYTTTERCPPRVQRATRARFSFQRPPP